MATQVQGEPPKQLPPNKYATVEQLELFQHLAQPVWVYDFIEERNVWTNRAGLELWNSPSLEEYRSRDRSKGRSASTLQMLQFVQSKIEIGEHIQKHWTLYPKGVATTVHITITGIPLNGHVCMLFHAVPVETESLETKTLLRGVEMLRHLPMAVCQFDMEGECMFQNQWAQLSEDTQPQQQEKEKECDNENSSKKSSSGFARRFVDQTQAEEAMKSIQNASDQTSVELEAELYGKNGNREWSNISLRKTTDPVTGKTVILYSAQDKSDAQRAEQEKSANVRKSEFLAIMAHEIRTPLHQVIGFIDLLEQTNPLTEEQRGYINLLQSSTNVLMTVISDVLDYSKLEAGEMKVESIPYEPRGVAEGSMAAVRSECQEKGLSLSMQWDKQTPFRIKGDPNRVRQILLNLLSNAMKFTEHGSISLQSTYLQNDNEHVCGLQEANQCSKDSNQWLRFTVKDTGRGVDKANQARIFQQYQQENLSVARTHGGTGLGLSICQKLVHAMGGAIGVESEVGKGSSFWVLLPARIPLSEPITDKRKESCDSTLARSHEAFHVLVAEDNRLNQKLITNMLKRLGHYSTVAENGQIAIDLLEERTIPFDAVLMDIQMPVLDGVEATRRLRTMGYDNLPILALTASVKQHNFADLGFDSWLPKPTPLKVLQEQLSTTVLRRQSGFGLMSKQ